MKHPDFFMVFRRCFLVGLVVGLGSLPIMAGTIEYGAIGNQILDFDATLSDDGNLVLVGTFTNGFDFGANATDFSTTFAAFTQYGESAIGTNASAASGQFSDTTGVTGVGGNRLYLWFFNNATSSSATAWAIVTNNDSAWTAPADSVLASTQIDASDLGTFIPAVAATIALMSGPNGNAQGVVNVDADVQMELIPEPSSAVLLVAGAISLALRRRSRF